MTAAQRRLLVALLISACDCRQRAVAVPGRAAARPRQLGVPAQFRENNLWLALEEAIPAWSNQPEAVPLVHWPELPPPGGHLPVFRAGARACCRCPEA